MDIEMVTMKTAEIAGQIHALAWKAGYQGILPQSYLDALSPQLWISRMKQAVYQDFLLKDDGHYVAAAFSPARDKNMSGWGEIVSLYVLPEHVRKGYGFVPILVLYFSQSDRTTNKKLRKTEWKVKIYYLIISIKFIQPKWEVIELKET